MNSEGAWSERLHSWNRLIEGSVLVVQTRRAWFASEARKLWSIKTRHGVWSKRKLLWVKTPKELGLGMDEWSEEKEKTFNSWKLEHH